MNSRLILPLLIAAGLHAQTPQIYGKPSGPWTLVESGKPAREITLPARPRQIVQTYLIRRTIQLPAGGLSSLALLATPFDSACEVRIDGKAVGRYSSPDSALYPQPEPRVFAIPDGPLHAGENELAFHLERRTLLDDVATPFPGSAAIGGRAQLASALPLGIHPEGVYAERELALGRQLTFVSDGVIEAANAKGELFGFERTAAVSMQPALEIAEAARAWGQNDDITVVTVRRAVA